MRGSTATKEPRNDEALAAAHLLLAALIGAWQLAASTGFLAEVLGLDSFLVPSPAEVGEALWNSRSLLAENAWVTLREILFGLACAFVVGVVFALLMHLSGVARDASYPLVVASQTIPIVVIAPILLVWLGFGIGPKVVVVALICFFPITVNTLAGLGSVHPDAIKLMRTLDASRWQILRRVEAPRPCPSFFTGAKIAVVLAPIGAVFGEWVGGRLGPRPPDPHGQRPARSGAGVRGGRRPLRDGPGPDRPRWPSPSDASSLGDRTRG